jgi:hypothetical protein
MRQSLKRHTFFCKKKQSNGFLKYWHLTGEVHILLDFSSIYTIKLGDLCIMISETWRKLENNYPILQCRTPVSKKKGKLVLNKKPFTPIMESIYSAFVA